MSRLNTFVPAIAFLAVFASAGIAEAAPISQWSFTVNQSFDPNGTEWAEGGRGSNSNVYGTGNKLPDEWFNFGSQQYSWMKWGDPATFLGSQSFLASETGVTRTVRTDGAAVSGARFYHGNYRISENGPPAPERMSLLSSIEISAVGQPGATFTVDNVFTIDFFETPNTGRLRDCEGYGSEWTGNLFTTACPDRLTVDISPMAFSTGEIDGYIYDFVVSFDLSDSSNILGLGFDGNLATLWTREGARSHIGTKVSVTAREAPLPPVEVPEPGSIALLGAGLVGAGFGLRRRR